MSRTGVTRRIALTGGIATGKSHVRARLETLGVPTIDADVLAREAVAPGTPGLRAVSQRFGPQVIRPDGTLDRKALGAVVFADTAARRDLEAIVHPVVRRATDEWFAALERDGAVIGVADVPLLYETGRDVDFESVIVAACAADTQLRRLMERDAISEIDARRRMDAQLPIAEKARRANYVISTEGTIEETNRQVERVWRQIAAH